MTGYINKYQKSAKTIKSIFKITLHSDFKKINDDLDFRTVGGKIVFSLCLVSFSLDTFYNIVFLQIQNINQYVNT